MRDANPQTIYLKDYTPPEFIIHQVELVLDLDATQTRVMSTITLERNPDASNPASDLLLLGEQQSLVSIQLDEQALTADQYQVDSHSLCINNVPQDKIFHLVLKTDINPTANTALEGLYLSNGMLCTQCEAEGFRKITYFLDRPDVMCRFKTTLRGDKDLYPVMLSNGNKLASGDLSDNRHWVTWEDPFAKPCYLFALVAGQLDCLKDSYKTCSDRTIALEIYVEPHDLDKCDHAMQSLKNAMLWDEQTFGLEYDLDLYMIVAVGHFNMGAMENKGLNIFNTKFVLARPDTATDTDYEYIEGVIGHEYFHNWTGNRVTCRDWFQLSLKEGLTVFRDQEFTSDQTSRAVKRIEDVNMLRTRQFAEDAGPLAHPIRPDSYIEINNFYTLTVYEKGAEVVRMIHTLLGAPGFRKGMDLYFQRHDGQAVTCDDFVSAMEAANVTDLTQFRRWYSQAGTPVVNIKQDYDANTKTLTLNMRQSCPATPGQQDKPPLHIPIRMGLLDESGNVLPISTPGDEEKTAEIIIDLTAAEQNFSFNDLPTKPVVSLLRGFSAPVKIEMPRKLEELAFLLAHDSDPFSRWEAGQQLASQIILGLVQAQRDKLSATVDPILIKVYQQLLTQDWDDLSYFSLLLTLPTENYLAEQMQVIDVIGIHQAREQVKRTLAENLQTYLQHIYQANHRDESGQFDSGAIGRRRIKNTCLSYLHTLQDDNAYTLSQQQFSTAANMTDQIAALSCIINSEHPEKTACTDAFYTQWQDEALVIDKWFSLQASSHMPNTYEIIKQLLQHPAFELGNPNRVRSLIGAFSLNNPVHFHRDDGQGYHFLADHVITLNAINPLVAARMTGALTSWRRYDQERQQLMQAQLQRIVSTPDISPDVYEMVSKSLA